jgi:DNA adenine methylase
MKTWHQQKALQYNPSSRRLIDLGFSTFFLNRCNRSGIIGGGVIGGKEQIGKWKLDARYNKEALIRRIQQIARFRERITLTNLDAVDFLKTRKRKIPKKSIAYLDPPYFVKGRRLYDSFYSYDDHAGIAKQVSLLEGINWLVSYDDVQEIRDLYKSFRSICYSLNYSAMDRYKGNEVMFFSDGLLIPRMAVSGPIHLTAS